MLKPSKVLRAQLMLITVLVCAVAAVGVGRVAQHFEYPAWWDFEAYSNDSFSTEHSSAPTRHHTVR